MDFVVFGCCWVFLFWVDLVAWSLTCTLFFLASTWFFFFSHSYNSFCFFFLCIMFWSFVVLFFSFYGLLWYWFWLLIFFIDLLTFFVHSIYGFCLFHSDCFDLYLFYYHGCGCSSSCSLGFSIKVSPFYAVFIVPMLIFYIQRNPEFIHVCL